MGYFISLAITLAVEIPMALLFGFGDKKSITCVVLVNLVTHPALSYLLWINPFWKIFPIHFQTILFLEIIVALAESFLLYYSLRLRLRTAMLLSFSMNAASFLVGILIASV